MITIDIDNILKQQHRTRYWLAKETNITYRNIVRLANNETDAIKFNNLEKICLVVNCTPNDILKFE
jgi:putative transcriptional regulator